VGLHRLLEQLADPTAWDHPVCILFGTDRQHGFAVETEKFRDTECDGVMTGATHFDESTDPLTRLPPTPTGRPAPTPSGATAV
jgi:hypothetical protein